MNFDIDVLINFAEKDNEAINKGEAGWISQFKKFLDLMLYQVLGSKPNVVIKSEFDGLTASNLGGAAILVVIASKEYVESTRCLETLADFYRVTSNSKINRVFKVLKSPLAIQEQPTKLKDLLGYEMYQLDKDSGEVKEYSDFFSQEAEKQYWMKLVDLAHDIHESLLSLKQGESKTEVKNIFKRKTVYLAETCHDISIQRNIIKRELQRHGYVVLPNRTLSSNLAELEREVRKDLEESSLSIHLIGAAYGEIPEGTDKSIVDIQNTIAADVAITKRNNKDEFSRLIWISSHSKNASERQKSFIENIKRDTEAQEGAEILQNALEDFKNIIREELSDPHEKDMKDDFMGKSIYLLHDKIDIPEVRPFKDAIQKSGFKVLEPSFEGELLEVRKNHLKNLRNLDAAIIFKGKVNDQWVQMKVLDLLKAPGFGRKKPILGKAIIGSESTSIDGFKNQNFTLISGNDSLSLQSLKIFLEEF